VEARERRAIDERVARYRACRRPVDLRGRAVVIVDDGIATGGTARAAVQVAKARGATSVMVAVPVAAPSSVDELLQVADGVVAYETPGDMMAIGRWYRDFGQTTDDEVMKILLAAEHATTGGSIDVDPAPVDTEVEIPVVSATLGGHLTIPAHCHGIVIFAHGSGSSRHSPRNRSVARFLNLAGIGTLLFDLLDDREATSRRNVFDIELLAHRLSLATQWLASQQAAHGMRIGYFGASTGAAAALWAASSPDSPVAAVVSRGGRPDLAMPRLSGVRAPTLLVVGGHDEVVLDLNEEAASHLRCPHRIVVVPGATHLFEEPGTLEQVARVAADWFLEHFRAAGDRPDRAPSTAGAS
jgi:putative phosphoribosyl transferase